MLIQQGESDESGIPPEPEYEVDDAVIIRPGAGAGKRSGDGKDKPKTGVTATTSASTPQPEIEIPRIHDLPGFTGKASSGAVWYYSQNQFMARASFIDHGSKIEVKRIDSHAAILAALRLAQMKWGANIVINGTPDQCANVARIAMENGVNVKIANPISPSNDSGSLPGPRP